MPKSVESNWNYFSATGHIVGSDLKSREEEFILGDPDATCKIYKITPNTKFSHQAWGAWWDKKPITISYKENPLYHITVDKTELIVFKATGIDLDFRATQKAAK